MSNVHSEAVKPVPAWLIRGAMDALGALPPLAKQIFCGRYLTEVIESREVACKRLGILPHQYDEAFATMLRQIRGHKPAGRNALSVQETIA